MPKICIYTVITGKYDHPHEHRIQTIKCDYICFTDDPELTSRFYKVIYYDALSKSDLKISSANQSIINAGLFRSNLFLIEPLKEYDICILIDANASITDPTLIESLLNGVNGKDYDIIISKHPNRKCVYTEAIVSMNIAKYENTDLKRQILDYQNDRYPQNNGLYWNGFVIYLKPFTEKMRQFYDLYTEHIIKYSKDPLIHFHPQGQVCLPYVLEKTQIKFCAVPPLYKIPGKVRIYPHN